jgi:hypothetical protein
MVGDSRRSRNPKNWRNIKKQYKYSRLIESESEDENRPIKNEENNGRKMKKEAQNHSDIISTKVAKNLKGSGSSWKIHDRMSSSVKNSMNFLKSLSKKSPSKRKTILKEFSDDKYLFDALSELSHNLIKGNIPLNSVQLKKIRKYSKVIKALDCPKTRKCKAKRRKIIEQSGGFLPILIPAAAAALGHLSGAIIRKIIK